MITTVIKRDGTEADFDEKRIYRAIEAADKARETEELDEVKLNKLVAAVCETLNEQESNEKTTVEEIQDVVEKTLMKQGYLDIAKVYILYRNRRTDVREAKSHLSQVFDDIYSKSREDSDLKRENANINTDAPMGVMLKVGSEASKDYSLKFTITLEYAQGHINGDWHIHDLDFYELTETCVQIPLGKLLSRGFTTGHGYSRPPQNIMSASALTCIAIQSSQNDMHGGQSVPCLDYDLAPYVAKSFEKILCESYKTVCELDGIEVSAEKEAQLKKSLSELYDIDKTIIYNKRVIDLLCSTYIEDRGKVRRLVCRVQELLDKQVYQAMEAFISSLNSMHSRAGGQVDKVA